VSSWPTLVLLWTTLFFGPSVGAAAEQADERKRLKCAFRLYVSAVMPNYVFVHQQSRQSNTVTSSRGNCIPQNFHHLRQGCILAPILFCVAIDCITQHMSFNPGITVGSSTFTDLVYADDAVLLLPSATDATTSLKTVA